MKRFIVKIEIKHGAVSEIHVHARDAEQAYMHVIRNFGSNLVSAKFLEEIYETI